MTTTPSASGLFHVEKSSIADSRIDILEKEVRDLRGICGRGPTGSIPNPVEKVCAICEASHSTEECPTIPAYKVMLQEQVSGIEGFKGNFGAPHGNSYNPS